MNSIESYQKITNLARELMRHGEAKSMNEAVRIAEAQYRSNPAVFDTDTIPVESASASGQELVQEQMVQSVASVTDTSGLMQENAMLLHKLQFVTANHTQEIDELNRKVLRLIQEMAEVREAARKAAESPIVMPRAKDDQAGQQAQLKANAVPIIGAPAGFEYQAKPKSHARTGNYNPDDVNIEKFFYFGRR
ncbi:hypothetical protein HZB03_02590 [Candidatus Woesearchaeota archaeon]|nr:hypothetical protein [Candidatus Woesearchaeota archaeon]